jgi:hypothetical protein
LFYYDWDVKYNRSKNEVNVEHYLKIQNGYIKPNQFKQYQADINKIDKSFGYALHVPKSEIGFKTSNNSLTLSFILISFFKLAIFALVLIGLILAVFWLYKKYKVLK